MSLYSGEQSLWCGKHVIHHGLLSMFIEARHTKLIMSLYVLLNMLYFACVSSLYTAESFILYICLRKGGG